MNKKKCNLIQQQQQQQQHRPPLTHIISGEARKNKQNHPTHKTHFAKNIRETSRTSSLMEQDKLNENKWLSGYLGVLSVLRSPSNVLINNGVSKPHSLIY